VTYDNECTMRAQACQRRTDISAHTQGLCGLQHNTNTLDIYVKLFTNIRIVLLSDLQNVLFLKSENVHFTLTLGWNGCR